MALGRYVTPDLKGDLLDWIRQDSGLVTTWPSLIVVGNLPVGTDKGAAPRLITLRQTGGTRSQEYPRWQPRFDVWVIGPQGHEAAAMAHALIDALSPYPPACAGFIKGASVVVDVAIQGEPTELIYPRTNWPARWFAIVPDVRLNAAP